MCCLLFSKLCMALLLAIQRGEDGEKVEQKCRKVDINENFHGKNFLVEACLYKNLTAVKILLKMGAKDIWDKDGFSAIFCATYAGSHQIVRLLLLNGFKVTSKVHDPFAFACEQTTTKNCDLYLEYGLSLRNIIAPHRKMLDVFVACGWDFNVGLENSMFLAGIARTCIRKALHDNYSSECNFLPLVLTLPVPRATQLFILFGQESSDWLSAKRIDNIMEYMRAKHML